MEEYTEKFDSDRFLEQLREELRSGKFRIELENQFLPPDEALTARVVPEICTESRPDPRFEFPEKHYDPSRWDVGTPRTADAPLRGQAVNQVHFDEVGASPNFWQHYTTLLESNLPQTNLPMSMTADVSIQEEEEEEEEEPSEFLRLCRELVEKPPRGWVDCTIEEGVLLAITDDVTLDDDYQWEMGQYTIELHDDLTFDIDNHSAQQQHPHYNGNWCFGNLIPLRNAAVAAEDPAAILTVIRELLGHYNPDDCFSKMGAIDHNYPMQESDEDSCSSCDNSIGEDDNSYVVDGNLLCGDCGGMCECCECDRWQDVLEECTVREGHAGCYRLTCDQCGNNCLKCGQTLCDQHSRSCDECDHIFCPKHLSPCTICEVDHCTDCLVDSRCAHCEGAA